MELVINLLYFCMVYQVSFVVIFWALRTGGNSLSLFCRFSLLLQSLVVFLDG